LLLSIVIPVQNEILYIPRSFESIILAGSQIDSEFFFVDGRSSDGTFEWIKNQIKEMDNCKLILNDKKFVSHGFNLVLMKLRVNLFLELMAIQFIRRLIFLMQ